MHLADRVCLSIHDFFASTRLQFEPEARNVMVGCPKKIDRDLTLLEHLMQAKPEIRAQEALYPFLVSKHGRVSREHQWINPAENRRRVFDFLVEEDGHQVIVELKHYTPHQTGGFKHLLGPIRTSKGRVLQSLHRDYEKARPFPLIQVGLFTAVEKWGPSQRAKMIDNRFIKSYVRRALPHHEYAHLACRDLGAWPFRVNYRCPAVAGGPPGLCSSPSAEFVTPAGITIVGRVNYFAGIALPQDIGTYF